VGSSEPHALTSTSAPSSLRYAPWAVSESGGVWRLVRYPEYLEKCRKDSALVGRGFREGHCVLC
jgi:hypothetical protein